MEGVPFILKDAGHSWKYWIIAVSVEVYLKNHILIQSVVSKTPYEAKYERKPFWKHLRVFKCLAFVHVPT